ncbi:MAG: hypothetical protein KGI38_02220 [Thaumarchaeota archaeon]|nr:hypothetical protein [Nitrososphaerota archaeon]
MTGEKPLQQEYQFYLGRKPELLRQAPGKFALIKGETLVGTYDTDADAYKVGLSKFGNVPFLIIRIQEKEEQTWTPILELGLLRANP